MTEPVDATVVEEVGTELVPHEAHAEVVSRTLFATDDPAEVIQKASGVAAVLKDVLRSQGMVQRIQDREHVLVSGWQTLGSMLGVVPVVVWTRELTNGWEARVEARTLDGRVVGAAEAMCTKDEKTWKNRDAYALRSMAQTRATSKALRGPLGFVVTLAGYDPTPAEEIPADAGPGDGFDRKATSSVDPPSDAQLAFLQRILEGKARGIPKPTLEQLKILVRRVGYSGPVETGWMKTLTKGQCSALISKIREEPLPDVDRPSDLPSDAPVHTPAGSGDDVPFSEAGG